MRIKLLSIKTCWQCPHFYNSLNPHCNMEEKPIPWNRVSPLEIPKWCPLPDDELVLRTKEPLCPDTH